MQMSKNVSNDISMNPPPPVLRGEFEKVIVGAISWRTITSVFLTDSGDVRSEKYTEKWLDIFNGR